MMEKVRRKRVRPRPRPRPPICDAIGADSADGGGVAVVVKDVSVFRLGECFDSYEELLKRLASHSKQSKVHYWRRDSRTVQGAYVKKTTRPLEPRLVYYYVKYACVFGGQKFLSRGTGQRQTVTMRTDCPAHIMLRASKSGRQLEVISVCNTHNHPITEELYKSLPQDRKLDPDIKQQVLDLLKLGVGHKFVLGFVLQATGKTLTSKDLFNLCAGEKPGIKSKRKKRTKYPCAVSQAPDSIIRNDAGDSGEDSAILNEALNNMEGDIESPPYEPIGTQVEIMYEGNDHIDLDDNKIIAQYLYPPSGIGASADMNTLRLIDGEEMTDSDIIIENVGIIAATESTLRINNNEQDAILQNNTFQQQLEDATTSVVDSVSNSMVLSNVKQKTKTIEDIINSNNEVLIQQIANNADSNNALTASFTNSTLLDQINLNNIVVIQHNLQQDSQLVQMYKLEDNSGDVLGVGVIDRVNEDANAALDDYIAFQADQDFVNFGDYNKSIIVDSLQDECGISLSVDSVDCIKISSSADRDQMCEACGRTGLVLENDIERLRREKEKIEREVKLLELKRDMLRNDIRRETGARDWNCILDASSPCENAVQYILVDQ